MRQLLTQLVSNLPLTETFHQIM